MNNPNQNQGENNNAADGAAPNIVKPLNEDSGKGDEAQKKPEYLNVDGNKITFILVGTKSDKVFESGDLHDDDDGFNPDRRRQND